ncbi:hypothetical protein Cgig2_013161 [Carnegiea gigantea]|uniref:Uncharacterized protein n=1 Tax=Carnegiea gigantea TaxID=171969 RepID=A0A9Q1KR27_9CARY|nr:hypothetical protein Cgig2_013161 [Carnegiea gigantea]
MGYYTMSSIIPLPIIISILHQFFKNSYTERAKLPPGPKTMANNRQHPPPRLQAPALCGEPLQDLWTFDEPQAREHHHHSHIIPGCSQRSHDLAFASRHVPDAIRILGHIESSMCPKWRHLRKISAIQLLPNQRLDASQGLRKKKVDELVKFAKGCCEKGLAIDIDKAAFTTSHNLLSNTFFSIDLSSYDSLGSREFKDLVGI